MMNPVYVRCDDNPSEDLVYRSGNVDVPVVKHGGGIEYYLEDQNRHR